MEAIANCAPCYSAETSCSRFGRIIRFLFVSEGTTKNDSLALVRWKELDRVQELLQENVGQLRCSLLECIRDAGETFFVVQRIRHFVLGWQFHQLLGASHLTAHK